MGECKERSGRVSREGRERTGEGQKRDGRGTKEGKKNGRGTR
jgi:hypothetical protein